MQKPPGVTSRTCSTRRRTPLRTLLLATPLLAAPLLAACGTSPMASAAGYFREGLLGGADLALTHEDVFKIPYASIAVRLGRGPQAFVVLATDQNHRLHWIAADKHLIETQNGRITETVGFPQDLTQTTFLNPDPLETHLDPTQTYSADRLIDTTDHTNPTGDSPTDQILVRQTLTCLGPQTLTILGNQVQTFLWTEKTTAPDINWTQTNKYWQDQTTNTIWKSQQNITPKLPQIEIITLRKYKE